MKDFDFILAQNAYTEATNINNKTEEQKREELEIYKKKNHRKITKYLKELQKNIESIINEGGFDTNITYVENNPLGWTNEIFEDWNLLKTVLDILRSKGYIIKEKESGYFDDSWVINYTVSWKK